jgi:uncharacterized protein (TIGR03437 family)
MAHLTRNGKRSNGLNLSFLPGFFLLSFLSSLSAQTPFLCSTSSTNQVVRAEGLAEPVGSILLNCNGGTPGQSIMANLSFTFSTNVTNRVNAAGNPDTSLIVDIGTGPVSSGTPATLPLPNVLQINGIAVTVPSSRTLVFRLTNVRLAIAPLSFPVIASISSTSLTVNNSMVTVATPVPALLSNGTQTGITCTGSPLPTTLDLPSLFAAGTRFNSLRVTEGFGNAFIPKDATSDTGTRIVVNYTNFPAGARVFLPDFVAGNSATLATAAGDLGGNSTPTGGTYTPTLTGTLLLARVIGHDANGAGGAPIGTAASFTATTALKTVTEVSLLSGAGVAVYEVVDANPSVQESAQFPTFIGLTTTANQPIVTANAAIAIGPVSAIATATTTDPIPRFRRTAPASDCQFLGDCTSKYFPLLSVGAPAAGITFRSPFNGLQYTEYITVNNAGGGTLNYSATVAYQNGSGFVFIDPTTTQGIANATIRVILNAAGLTPGTYTAQLLISAGAAGSRTIPITLTVDPVVLPPVPAITVSSVTNAATLAAGPLVAGSLGTIKGTNLAGTNVSVTFDAIPAPILYKSATQINFQVPAVLAAKSTTQLIVTVDGVATAPQTIALAQAAPGIFGILNQDGTLNSGATPAPAGTVLQIFATGLATQGFSVLVNGAVPTTAPPGTPSIAFGIVYAGDAPGLPGVQQVNAVVNSPSGATAITVCSASAALNACTSAPLYVK